MKKTEMFQAMGEIDDDLLTDAEEFLHTPTTSKVRYWIKWCGLAACLTRFAYFKASSMTSNRTKSPTSSLAWPASMLPPWTMSFCIPS